MGQGLSNVSTLVPEALRCMVYTKRCQVHLRFHTDGIGFADTLI